MSPRVLFEQDLYGSSSYSSQIGFLDRILNSNINWLYDGRYAMIAILILTIWKDFGYAVILLLGAMYSLPVECYEAAETDGATAWQRFRFVTHFRC